MKNLFFNLLDSHKTFALSLCKHPHDSESPHLKELPLTSLSVPQSHLHFQKTTGFPADIRLSARPITIHRPNRFPVRSIALPILKILSWFSPKVLIDYIYQSFWVGDMEQSRSLVGGRLLLFFIGQVFKNDHPYQPAHRCPLLACQRPKFVHRFRGEEHIRSLAVALWPRRHSTHLLHVYYITILSPWQGVVFI